MLKAAKRLLHVIVLVLPLISGEVPNREQPIIDVDINVTVTVGHVAT